MSGPLRESITHLDWVVSCSPPKFIGDAPAECDSAAKWFVHFHMVGRCVHPACNESGNLEYLVCDTHLTALEASAGRTVRKLHPPSWLKWFRVDPFEGRCTSCRRLIQSVGDIVQIVRSLV